MNVKISKQDILWSYLGYALKIGSNIIILPLILKILPSEEVGVWYVFLAIGSFMQLLDLGFTPTIMRNISYAHAGAKELQKEGVPSSLNSGGVSNYQLIWQLIIVSKQLYFYIAIITLFFLITFGSWYIVSICKMLDNMSFILLAWLIYCLGIFFNFYYSYWMPVLTGIGKIKQSQKAAAISHSFYLLTATTGLLCSYGLMALALAFLLSGFILRYLSKRYFYKLPEFNNYRNTHLLKEQKKNLFLIIWFNARRIGLVQAGGYLIVQANTLLCSTYLGLKTTAAYGVSLQLFMVLMTFSTILFRTYLPAINEARVKRDLNKLRCYLGLTILVGWFLFFNGAGLIIFLGDSILQWIGSKTSLLNREMLAFMAVYLFLETNHSNFATFIVTRNEVPFVKASLYSGILIVMISLSFLKFSGLGLWGLLLSQAGVQLLYNNWKWPCVVLKELDVKINILLLIGLKEFSFKLKQMLR